MKSINDFKDFGEYLNDFLSKNAWITINKEEYDLHKDDENYARMTDTKSKKESYCKRNKIKEIKDEN